MYGAGGETTYSTVLTFIMTMALYPDKQQRAHKELSQIIGSERLPRIEDCTTLPYLGAVIKETMRWHPVLPLSIARRTACDDWYKGFFIPKNTIVVPNVWSIAHSDNHRFDPRDFQPERFLDPNHTEVDPAHWAFGFGRRVCPGKALGENSVFILIATLLWSFEFSVDETEGLEPSFGENLVRCVYPPQANPPFSLSFFSTSNLFLT
jgi:cytochrome P450